MKQLLLTIPIVLFILTITNSLGQNIIKPEGSIDLLEPIKKSSSHSVTITSLEYTYGDKISSNETIKIPSDGYVHLKANVLVFNHSGVFQGFRQMMYRKNSTGKTYSIGNPVYRENRFMTNWVSEITFILTKDMFESGKIGSLFAKFESNWGNRWLSDGFKVSIDQVGILNNKISGNQTIKAGKSASVLTGTMPTGGNGSYSFQWQKQSLGERVYTNIPGATSKDFNPGILNKTTYFRRIVKSYGFNNTVSNQVLITVEIPLANNVICCDQTLNYDEIPATLTGTIPGDGSGDFVYDWDSRTKFPGKSDYGIWTNTVGNSKDYVFKRALPDYAAEPYYVQYRRHAYSVKTGRSSFSNIITIKQNPDNKGIRNNSISTSSGSGVFNGTTPTGGSGSYTYQWYFTIECAADHIYAYNEPIPGATSKDHTVTMPWVSSSPCKETLFFHRLTTDSEGRTQYSNSINMSGGDSSDYFGKSSSKSSKKQIVSHSQNETELLDIPEIIEGKKDFNLLVDNLTEQIKIKSNFKKDTNLNISLVSIIDGKKSTVYEGKVKKGNWNFEYNTTKGINKGIYVCRIIYDGEVFSKKIIIR
ncbi:hypothetical protein F7018_09375 [Tenacibaculum aiptasiae]|uniref:Uncharacterized protein n=1 Tax=Tenacibaculum aiptasiae TaxID=426481 RepID=A0A7J5AL93_9FLAO|nr:hypothetical protein [Tenacibaculum aiptasiae]KAB1158377.1 hypothetical protein F7018_09375 [Tenacibaculum aiptasiae]